MFQAFHRLVVGRKGRVIDCTRTINNTTEGTARPEEVCKKPAPTKGYLVPL
jgi:hypothetical protein